MINADFLRKQAQELRSSTPELVAIDMLKKAGFDDTKARALVAQELVEKQACSSLREKGFDAEDAVKLVKAAKLDVSALQNFDTTSPEEVIADTLEKAAAAMDELQARLDGVMEQFEAATGDAPELPESILKMAQAGNLTHEDLDAIVNLPKSTMSKMAAAMDEPWSMGAPHGQQTAGLDPLAAFLMGND